jgi:hypothetical protein
MQLELEEQIKITDLMYNYKKIHEQINSVESRLKDLIDEQNKLSSELDNYRNLENEFGQYLKQKYGQGELNALTLEYTVK